MDAYHRGFGAALELCVGSFVSLVCPCCRPRSRSRTVTHVPVCRSPPISSHHLCRHTILCVAPDILMACNPYSPTTPGCPKSRCWTRCWNCCRTPSLVCATSPARPRCNRARTAPASASAWLQRTRGMRPLHPPLPLHGLPLPAPARLWHHPRLAWRQSPQGRLPWRPAPLRQHPHLHPLLHQRPQRTR